MAEDHPNENKRAYLFRACCSQEVRGFWPRAGERGRGKAWSEGKLGVQERGVEGCRWASAPGVRPEEAREGAPGSGKFGKHLTFSS